MRGADAYILDLEDSVPPAEKAAARESIARNFAAAWSIRRSWRGPRRSCAVSPPRHARNPLGRMPLRNTQMICATVKICGYIR
jgi:hypothetical protein